MHRETIGIRETVSNGIGQLAIDPPVIVHPKQYVYLSVIDPIDFVLPLTMIEFLLHH